MVWHDLDDHIEKIEETWEEYSTFHLSTFRFLTFSEFDQIEKPSVYHIEQNVPPYGAFDRDFVPLNFLSSLFLHTHKGEKLFLIDYVNNFRCEFKNSFILKFDNNYVKHVRFRF